MHAGRQLGEYSRNYYKGGNRPSSDLSNVLAVLRSGLSL